MTREEEINKEAHRVSYNGDEFNSFIQTAEWADLGESDCNWYWSDDENKFLKYINGKRIN